MNESDLRLALTPSLRRDVHMLTGAAGIAASISVAAIAAPVTRWPEIVAWFVGCAVFAVIARVWYRWHRRTCDQVVAAVVSGTQVSNVAIARFTINWIIPFGYVVALDVGTQRNVNVAFWWRRDAQRFVDTLAGSGYSGDGELPRARMVR